jgi:hypothetical protein
MGARGVFSDKKYAPRGEAATKPRLSVSFLKLIPSIALIVMAAVPLYGQGNYEIQVYGADTVAPGRTMVELHSNFTFEGFKTLQLGVLPDEHQEHETVEITQGWTNWFETGLYIFTSYGPNQGYKWVGDHIRPRVRVPDSWHWPVGVSVSTEIGYQRPIFSADTWTWEIRPIVDKQWKSWYVAFNPALERSFHGPSVPNVFSQLQGGLLVDAKIQRRLGILRFSRARDRL